MVLKKKIALIIILILFILIGIFLLYQNLYNKEDNSFVEESIPVFIKYRIWTFGTDIWVVSFLENGDFEGWKIPEDKKIPFKGTLTEENMRKIRSLLVEYDFSNLSENENKPSLIDGGSNISISFQGQTKEFKSLGECKGPENSCEFLKKMEELLNLFFRSK